MRRRPLGAGVPSALGRRHNLDRPMLQLENRTPFASTLAALPDARGIDTLHVLVRATFTMQKARAVATEQVPICLADEHYGEPDKSSLRYASEVHLPKPATDVVLVGSAWTAASPRRDQVDVLLDVAGRSKVLRVFGDRYWTQGLLRLAASPPLPFDSMPIVYERAYGGVHRPTPDAMTFFAEERNPVGTGFRGKRATKDFVGQLLPNIEDPRQLIDAPGTAATPQGFGFIAAHWMPRRRYAGTYDDAWRRTRAPILPQDFDPRFNNAAHPDFVLDRHLRGGEPVVAVNLCAAGPLRFDLPICEFEVTASVGGERLHSEPRLECVLLEPDADRLCLSWRATVPVDKKLLRVEFVQVAMRRLHLDGKDA